MLRLLAALQGCTLYKTSETLTDLFYDYPAEVAKQAPYDRAHRSSFQLYRSEDNVRMFAYLAVHYHFDDKAEWEMKSRDWLVEWMRGNDYCRRGYDIVSSESEENPR